MIHFYTKWYVHKPESVIENELHKILWDFEIQTHHLIPIRRPDQMQINKQESERKRENLPTYGFCRSSGPQSENENNLREIQVLGPCQRIKEAEEHEGDGNTSCGWCTRNGHKKLGKGIGKI